MDNNMILAAVERTGFPLEHRTSLAFIKHHWSIVPNKYYVDDSSGEAREIDLIAYKATQVDDVLVYSTVVVSCKKSNDTKWAFLTRSVSAADRNKDLSPLHFWTNNKPLEYSLRKEGFSRTFCDRLEGKSPSIWGVPNMEVFGFQELQPSYPQKSTGKESPIAYKPANDKAIFSSITSLMKAQAYELDRLPGRKTKQVIYIFSLLSLMDGDMVDVNYDGLVPAASETTIQKYIAHYIIKGVEQYCRINFVHAGKLEDIILEYNAAHVSSTVELRVAIKEFYKGVFEDAASVDILLKDFSRKITPYINIYGNLPTRVPPEDISLSFDKEKSTVQINISTSVPDGIIENLNNIDNVTSVARAALKKVYRYEGKFEFLWNIPF